MGWGSLGARRWRSEHGEVAIAVWCPLRRAQPKMHEVDTWCWCIEAFQRQWYRGARAWASRFVRWVYAYRKCSCLDGQVDMWRFALISLMRGVSALLPSEVCARCALGTGSSDIAGAWESHRRRCNVGAALNGRSQRISSRWKCRRSGGGGEWRVDLFATQAARV
jgi:hypothetical protein